MKILHVGWGFQPFRTGGLIEYAEDLMGTQLNNGYDVRYFCTGRFMITSKKPVLKEWKSTKGYHVYELWNPPVISGFDNGIENPMADITETNTENVVMGIIRQFCPDIVHIQEFLGFPTSLIENIKLLKIKTVYTVEDYYYLCPTIKLVLLDGQFCKIKGPELGKQCAICCHKAPKNNLIYKLQNVYPKIFNPKTVGFLQRIKKFLLRIVSSDKAGIPGTPDETKEADFNKRRDYNLDLLPAFDVVIAMSNRVAEIINYYKPVDNIITLNLTLKHIEKIQPDKLNPPLGPKIIVGGINVLSAPLKGKDLLLQLFEMIDRALWKDKIEFKILGYIDAADSFRIKKYNFVEWVGKFKPSNLNQILDDLKINVGIVPSLWEEAYGFVGIEFLAKGIPVIGNNMGGIPDYVNKETGWLNYSCNAQGMFDIISDIIENQGKIQSTRENLINNRDKYVKSMDNHFYEMDHIYKKLLNPE